MIRPATPLDAGQVGAILSAFVDETPWMPRIHTRAEDLAHCAQMIDRGWVTVAQSDGITGFLAQQDETIHALYVAPDARRRGIGRQLIAHAKAQRAALRLWTFQANAGAQSFYAREGFHAVQQTDGRHNDEGLPDVEFHWQRTAVT